MGSAEIDVCIMLMLWVDERENCSLRVVLKWLHTGKVQ